MCLQIKFSSRSPLIRKFSNDIHILFLFFLNCIYLMKSTNIKYLRVATLNFSGINVSPFQYHDGSAQKDLINKCFRKLLDEFMKENPDKKWNIAKIDKILQRERYSILYKPTAGVVRGRLLNRNEFQAVWDTLFEQNQHLVNHLTPSEQSIDLLRCFDWMMYQAFVTTLFGKVNWANMKGYNIQRYVEDLRKWHQKSYLKWQPKINYVKNYIIRQNLDILFLQEAGHQKLEASIPQDYISFRAGEAMIIVKKYFVIEDPEVSKFHLKYGSKLNFNHDSHYVKLKDYLLCCAHLSSKSLNVKQAEEMENLFREIRGEYQGLNIIAGVDANHFLKDFTYLGIYPSMASEVTTRKKRSSMQLQFQKSEKLIEEAKDHIITNLTFQEIKVETINCQEATTELLPNEEHPYDHFIVFGTLVIKQKQEEPIEDIHQNHSSLLENNRFRVGSLAVTQLPNESSISENKVITVSQSVRSVNNLNFSSRRDVSPISKKVERTSDLLQPPHNPDRAKFCETMSYYDSYKMPPPPKVSWSKEKPNRHAEDLLKPHTQQRIHMIRPHQIQSKEHNVQRLDFGFLQFNKTKPSGASMRNNSRTKDNHEKEELKIGTTLTPKFDKSKELGSVAYKKY